MNFRRLVAAAIATAALLAVNLGSAESASAGTSWHISGQDQQTHTFGTSWS
jgi:hypothetical protein